MPTLRLVPPGGWDRLPGGAWIALQAAALWPHGRWAVARLADGSDEPLGLAAAALLVLLLARLAPALEAAPRRGWLALAATLTLAATLGLWTLPPLAAALLAAAALAAGLAAWLPESAPRLALALLVLLALPVVASLQFYAGYPLRLVTAELSTALLQAAGFDAARSGAAMTVDGRLVIIDAPCSGVQLAWFGYFCAAGSAAWTGLADAALLRRLPAVCALVLTGNVLRNSLLVALEARPAGLTEGAHEGLGLAVLVAVCAAVIVATARSGDAHGPA